MDLAYTASLGGTIVATSGVAQADAIGSSTFLTQGGAVVCTVTDIAPPMLSVTKTVVGAGPWSFDFTISPVPSGQPAVRAATDLAPMVVWTGLSPSVTYTVTETLQDGYTSGALSCVGSTTQMIVADADVAPSATFAAAMGDSVVCRVTNTPNDLPGTGVDPSLALVLALALLGLGLVSVQVTRQGTKR